MLLNGTYTSPQKACDSVEKITVENVVNVSIHSVIPYISLLDQGNRSISDSVTDLFLVFYS